MQPQLTFNDSSLKPFPSREQEVKKDSSESDMESRTQVLVFCLHLIKWQPSRKAQSPLLQKHVPGSVASATRSPASMQVSKTSSPLPQMSECQPHGGFHSTTTRGKCGGGRVGTLSSFRDFLIGGKAIPSGPHPHRLDYSRHYKGMKITHNSKLLSFFFFYLLFIIISLRESVPNTLLKFKKMQPQRTNTDQTI